MILTVVAGFLICSKGLQDGLEKLSKIMMIALLFLIIILAAHSLTLSGASEGLSFYLIPRFSTVQNVGLGNVISAAMNQAFFTLSLGVAAMEIFGSYMSKDNTLAGEGIRICALDTFVAIMAGLIIFPPASATVLRSMQVRSLSLLHYQMYLSIWLAVVSGDPCFSCL